jgi:hypothetical protein
MDTGLVYREIKPASFWGTWSCAVAVYLSVTFESSTQKGNSTTSSTVTPAATSLAGRPAVRVDSVRCLEREQRERESRERERERERQTWRSRRKRRGEGGWRGGVEGHGRLRHPRHPRNLPRGVVWGGCYIG